MTQEQITETRQSTCKECENILTPEDIEKVGHNRRGYCIRCNKQYKKDNRNKKRVKVLDSIHTGDNLKVMGFIENEFIDLIYLDPPYYSQANYKNGGNEFSDNWKSIDEYLEFMKVRLEEMYRILKSTGSIYLHVDHHAVFELKPIMDKIFGRNNFRNDIIWSYSSGGTPKTNFARKHDDILFYTKSDDNIFNIQRVPYQAVIAKKREHLFHPDGKVMADVWDISMLSTQSKERLGYPTQKPLKLLERIIKASSNEGDIVLDPFCGSGTTLDAARKLNRKFIGIDEKKQAVNISKERIPKYVQQTIGE